jgi:hypothetical protein
MIFFKGQKAVLRTRTNRDVVNPDLSDMPQTARRAFCQSPRSGCGRLPEMASLGARKAAVGDDLVARDGPC